MDSRLSRRQVIGGLAIGAAGTSMLAATTSAEESSGPAGSPAPNAQPPGACKLLPQAVEGPYYFDPALVRSDITEGRPGLPLQLVLRVIETGPCTPIGNARVDIWHADAGGIYSGYDRQGDNRDTSTKGLRYLRGTQMTDADGHVVFHTIYPGWYPGRTPHIHVKVFLDEKTLLTGQIYFPDELSARVYRDREPYEQRPTPDTTNETDGIFKGGQREGGGTVLAIKEEPDLIVASLLVGVDRTGEAANQPAVFRGLLRGIFGGP